MRFIFILLSFLTSFYLISCASASKKGLGSENNACFEDKTCKEGLICKYDECVKDKCFNVQCDQWLSCNPKNGECDIINEGYCLEDKNCKVGEACNNKHKCIEKEIDPCEDNPCKYNIDGRTQCIKYSDNERGYICRRPDNPCENNPCATNTDGNTNCVNDSSQDNGYKCICENGYKQIKTGECKKYCLEDCGAIDKQCKEYNKAFQCVGGDGVSECFEDDIVKISNSSIWFGTTEQKNDNYELYCGDRALKGADTVYKLDVLEDSHVTITLSSDEVNLVQIMPTLSIFNSSCELLELPDAPTTCIVPQEYSDNLVLDLDLPVDFYYIVIDSVNNIPFDFALEVNFNN